MRIAHFAQFGPRSSGLYETVKDLILAERRCGVDAVLIDTDGENNSRVDLRDGEIVTEDPAIAYDSDVLIRHSGIIFRYQNIGKPVIMCLHGRPQSSWRLSAAGINQITEATANKGADARYKAFVTFWPQHETAWQSLVGDKIRVLPAPVDLDYYSPGRGKQLSGSYKILIADIWRDDVTPFDCIFGIARYVRQFDPQARLHLVGLPAGKKLAALKPLLKGLQDVIGSAAGQMSDIRDYYRACDLLVTPHVIATRTIREALACGLPVLAGYGCPYTEYTACSGDDKDTAEQIDRARNDPRFSSPVNARKQAESLFDSSATARSMIDLCREITGTKSKTRKVFFDIGAHLGETVRRFYRERTDSQDYEIYCFEPDPAIYKKLVQNVGCFANVHCLCSCLAARDGKRNLMTGTVNDGDGSTMMTGKLTGGLAGATEVEGMDIATMIARIVDPDDYCIVKMNCEGAEYELLPHLAKTRLMDRIDELYVQMHSIKFDTARRVKMDSIELQWTEQIKSCKTRIMATTKGMASFGNS